MAIRKSEGGRKPSPSQKLSAGCLGLCLKIIIIFAVEVHLLQECCKDFAIACLKHCSAYGGTLPWDKHGMEQQDDSGSRPGEFWLALPGKCILWRVPTVVCCGGASAHTHTAGQTEITQVTGQMASVTTEGVPAPLPPNSSHPNIPPWIPGTWTVQLRYLMGTWDKIKEILLSEHYLRPRGR